MKKVMSIVAMFAALAMFASCDKEEFITESQLPSASSEFLRTHFGNVDILSIVKEADGLDKDYTAYLANGFEVDFTRSGAWDEVDGRINAVPQSVLDLLPGGIVQYVDTNFATSTIVKINKERHGYEIGLNGDVELMFNSNGEFHGYDD